MTANEYDGNGRQKETRSISSLPQVLMTAIDYDGKGRQKKLTAVVLYKPLMVSG